MIRIRFCWVVVVMMLVSCSEDEADRTNAEEYFPMVVGMYQVYDIQEIQYSAFSPPVLSTYQLQQEIIDSFKNGEGGITYVIHRSIRQQATDDWNYLNTWSMYRSDQFSVVQEENIKFVKLIDPLQVNNQWNGNLFNSLGEDSYRIESIGKVFSDDQGSVFENTVVVNQSDERNLLFQDERIEVYASGVGLVFKESNVIQFSTSGGLPGVEIIGGYYWKQVLTAYGKR